MQSGSDEAIVHSRSADREVLARAVFSKTTTSSLFFILISLISRGCPPIGSQVDYYSVASGVKGQTSTEHMLGEMASVNSVSQFHKER